MASNRKLRGEGRAARRLAMYVVAVVFGMIPPRSAAAEIERYEMTVKGLACPFCVLGVEKQLKALPGVRNVTVDLESGKATFDVTGEHAVMPQRVRDAIRRAGFTPSDDITITATGRPELGDGELRLRVDADDAVNLVGGKQLDRAREAAAKPASSITVTGTVKRVGNREILSAESVRTSERK